MPKLEPSLFPLYQLIDAFEAFSHGEPDVKPQHRSLYYFLLAHARKRGNVPRFTLAYEAGMHGSAIGSWTTYDAAMKALHMWGFIVYTPGANRFKVPVVALTFRNPAGDELLAHWQQYCLAHSVELQNSNPNIKVELQNLTSTSNPTSNPTGDIKKTIRHKTIESAADAATPLASLPAKKSVAKKSKTQGATHEQIAALPLPFDGEEFATTWRSFYTTNTKQVGKHLSAFELMLKKLGKYPEAFAVLMLERAIMGNWQGIENDGTARGFAEWQAEQARNPQPVAAPTLPAPSEAPDLNEEFLAQQVARQKAAQDAHFARWAVKED